MKMQAARVKDFQAKMKQVYRSDNLCVRAIPGLDRRRWFITFDHVSHDHSLDRAGFGEAYFRARGISILTVLGRGNHWYQYPDTLRALEAVRVELAGARQRIVYGTSMGAYAALRFAERVDATACLAISPQYSVDPRKAPFERRWIDLSRSIQWRDELDGPIRSRIAPILVFDPRSDDARHAHLIASDIRVMPVAIAHGGHPVTTYLNSAGLLEGLIDAVYDQSFDHIVFQNVARRRRKASPAWIAELARRQPPHRVRWAEKLAREALRLNPGSDLCLYILAEILLARRQFGEALETHARAYEASNRTLEYGLGYSAALDAAGLPHRALNVAIELQDRYPRHAHLLKQVIELHVRNGEMAVAAWKAEAVLATAGTDKADIDHYRRLLKGYRESRHPMVLRRARAWLRKTWRKLNYDVAGSSGSTGFPRRPSHWLNALQRLGFQVNTRHRYQPPIAANSKVEARPSQASISAKRVPRIQPPIASIADQPIVPIEDHRTKGRKRIRISPAGIEISERTVGSIRPRQTNR